MKGTWKFMMAVTLQFAVLVQITESLCQKEFFTRFDDSIGSYGHMFNIRKKEGGDEILLTGLDIFTDVTKQLNYKLYTREGSYKDALTDITGWETLSQGRITGKGGSDPTPLPLFESKIRLAPGDVRGFYVTLTTPDLRYRYGQGGDGDEEIQQENNSLQIWEGTGILVYPLGVSNAGPRMFLGVVRYETYQECSSGGGNDSVDSTPSPTRAPDQDLKTTAVPFTFLVKHSASIPLIQVVNGINSDVEVSIQTLLTVDKDLSGYVQNDSLTLLGAKSFLVANPSFAVNCDNIFGDTICSVIETVVGLSHSSYVQQSTIREKLMSTGETMSNFFVYESEYIGETSVVEDVLVKIFNVDREMTRNEQASFGQQMLSFLGPRLSDNDVVLESIEITGQQMSAFSNDRRTVEIARKLPDGLRSKGHEILKYRDRLLKDVPLLTITLSVKAQHLPPPSLKSLVQSAIENDSVVLLKALQQSSIGPFFTSASFEETVSADDNDDGGGDGDGVLEIPEEPNPDSGDSVNAAAVVVPLLLLLAVIGMTAFYFLKRDQFDKLVGDKLRGMRIGRGEDKTSIDSDDLLHEKEQSKSREERSGKKRRNKDGKSDRRDKSERNGSSRHGRKEEGRGDNGRDRSDYKGSNRHRRREGEHSERNRDRIDYKGSSHDRRKEGERRERDRDCGDYKGSGRRKEGGRNERDRDSSSYKGSSRQRRREEERNRDRSDLKGSSHHRRREEERNRDRSDLKRSSSHRRKEEERNRDRSDLKRSSHHRRREEGRREHGKDRDERSRRRGPARQGSRMRRENSGYDSEGDAGAKSRRTRSSSRSRNHGSMQSKSLSNRTRQRQETHDDNAARKSRRPGEDELLQDQEGGSDLVNERMESGSDRRKESGGRSSHRQHSHGERHKSGSRRRQMRRKDDRKSTPDSGENTESNGSSDEVEAKQKERRSSSDLLNSNSAHPRLQGGSEKTRKPIRKTKSSHQRNLDAFLEVEGNTRDHHPTNANCEVSKESSHGSKSHFSDQQKSTEKSASDERDLANSLFSDENAKDTGRDVATSTLANNALAKDECSSQDGEGDSEQKSEIYQELEINSQSSHSGHDRTKDAPSVCEADIEDVKGGPRHKKSSPVKSSACGPEEKEKPEDTGFDDCEYEIQEEDHRSDGSYVKEDNSAGRDGNNFSRRRRDDVELNKSKSSRRASNSSRSSEADRDRNETHASSSRPLSSKEKRRASRSHRNRRSTSSRYNDDRRDREPIQSNRQDEFDLLD